MHSAQMCESTAVNSECTGTVSHPQPKGEGAILGENMSDKPNTPVNCELDWSMQWHAHNRGRHSIASIGLV